MTHSTAAALRRSICAFIFAPVSVGSDVVGLVLDAGPAGPRSGRARAGGSADCLSGGRVLVVAEVELVDVGVGAVGVEVDAGFDAGVEDKGVLVKLHESRGEDRAHERS